MQFNRNKSILLFGSFFILFSNCTDKPRSIEKSELGPKDDIGFWITEKNAKNTDDYKQNLISALFAVKKMSDDSIKAEYASQLSLKFMILEDSTNFRAANQLAMNLAEKRKDTSKMAGALWDAGDFWSSRGIEDSAFFKYRKANELFSAVRNDYDSGRMLYNMAYSMGTIKDYTAAETYAIEAVKLFKPLKKYARLYKSYNYLGIISNNLKEYEKALEYHQQALNYLEKMDSKSTFLASSTNNIGAIYRDQGNLKAALGQFETAVGTDSLYFKDVELYAKALSNLGYSQYKLGDVKQGETNLKKAIALQDSIKDDKSLSRSYFNISELYLDHADTSASLLNAKLAKMKAQASDNNLRVLETLGLLTKIDPKNATAYTQEYIMLNDSLQIAERR